MKIAVYMEAGRVSRVATSIPAEIAVVIEDSGDVWAAPLSVEDEIGRYCQAACDATRCNTIGALCEVASEAFLELSRGPYDCSRSLLLNIRAVLQTFYGGLEDAAAY